MDKNKKILLIVGAIILIVVIATSCFFIFRDKKMDTYIEGNGGSEIPEQNIEETTEPEFIPELCGTIELEEGWKTRDMSRGMTLYWEQDYNAFVTFVNMATKDTQGLAFEEIPAVVAENTAVDVEDYLTYDGLTVQWGESEEVTVAGQDMIRLHGEALMEDGKTVVCRLYAYFLHANYEYIPFKNFPAGAVLAMKLNDRSGKPTLATRYVEQLEADLDRMMESFCPDD